jgi:hypothetical protein
MSNYETWPPINFGKRDERDAQPLRNRSPTKPETEVGYISPDKVRDERMKEFQETIDIRNDIDALCASLRGPLLRIGIKVRSYEERAGCTDTQLFRNAMQTVEECIAKLRSLLDGKGHRNE